MNQSIAWIVALLLLAGNTLGKTSNGNDFALYLSEAQTAAEQQELIADAKGRPHYFRYLCIVAMQEGQKEGRPYVKIKATEPASRFHILFTVQKPASVGLLKQAPTSGIGDAIAVTGKVTGANTAKKNIELNPVIVRHKDRLAPKIGKELFYELDPNATCYAYTVVEPGVQVPYKYRDLLQYKDDILKKQGPKAWVDFLNSEMAKRKRAEQE